MPVTDVRRYLAMIGSCCRITFFAAVLAWGAVFLTGCATYQSQEYVSQKQRASMADVFTVEINLTPTRTRFHIPFVFLRTRYGSPYMIELIGRSRIAKSDVIYVQKLLLKVPGGQVYDILQGTPVSLVLDPIPVSAMPSRRSTTATLARGSWQSKRLPLDFAVGSECTAVLHCRVDDRTYIVHGVFEGEEERGRNLILTVYNNV